jgi:hypothetical protein
MIHALIDTGYDSVSLHAASLPSTLSPPPPRPLPPKTGDAPPVVTSAISYKNQIPDRPRYSPLYRSILPSFKSFFTLNRVSRQQSLTAITPLINVILASLENFVPAFHPHLFAFNNAITLLKAIHDRLRVAEDHITTIAARDEALVSRLQEAEAVVQQTRATMGENETENRILKESLKDAESKVQHAEQRASAAEESLANVNRLLQSPVGQENKWCHQQSDALQPDLASEEAHLQAPQTVLSTSPSVNSKSTQASLPLLDDTARSEAEARIADLTGRFSQSEAAAATAQAHMRDLTARRSSTRDEAELALARANEQVQTAKDQASAAEARAVDLQVELSRHNRVVDDYTILLRDAEERSTRMDALTQECQKALTAAVLRGDQEASERRAAQLTLESICAERGSPFVVPPLLDALRLIVRHSAHTKR